MKFLLMNNIAVTYTRLPDGVDRIHLCDHKVAAAVQPQLILVAKL
jgi:hypothetical protein